MFKRKIIILTFLALLPLLSGCTLFSTFTNSNSQPQNQVPTNQQQGTLPSEPQPTLVQGLSGTAKMITGNCMPGPAEIVSKSSCKSELLADRTVYIRELTKFQQQGQTKIIATVKTDNNGYYQVELPAGSYSVFIETESGEEYCNLGDGSGNMCPVTVNNNELTKYDITINLAAY